MTLVPARHVPRVLLACDDPLESQLLRSLLRALPGSRPEVMVAEPDTPGWTAAVAAADCCFISFSGTLPLAQLKVRESDGSTRAARADDVRHLRWTLGAPIAAHFTINLLNLHFIVRVAPVVVDARP